MKYTPRNIILCCVFKYLGDARTSEPRFAQSEFKSLQEFIKENGANVKAEPRANCEEEVAFVSEQAADDVSGVPELRGNKIAPPTVTGNRTNAQ
ncbi:MAG TPA: hypothetical protein VMV74_07980 [Bacteroidales bacterium]|nr:hypothetical protein [Bacteroidales bacterium]